MKTARRQAPPPGHQRRSTQQQALIFDLAVEQLLQPARVFVRRGSHHRYESIYSQGRSKALALTRDSQPARLGLQRPR